MYTANPNYLEHIDSSLIRRPKSKIVVDGKEYSGGRYLTTYPKISHKTDKAIGSFPAKTCEFEIYNPDGDIDLHGKEITVYRGLEIDGLANFVKVGIFSASDENIKTNINKKTISFKGTDRTLLLDKPYGGREQWDESKLIDDIVKEICTRNGVNLGVTEIPLSGYTFPEIPSELDFDNLTDRQLIAYIAELGGRNAMINTEGRLIFCSPVSSATNRKISKKKYKNLSVKSTLGPINAISFGHRDYEDAYLYRKADVTDETMIEWAINDNPLTSISNKAALARRMSQYFFDRTFVAFEVEDLIDDYIFELNDRITIEKKDGETVDVTILEMETTSRIKSKFGASVQTPGKTDTALAGGIKEQIKKVELKVNHQEGEIKALIEDVDSTKTLFQQTSEALSATAAKQEQLIWDVSELSEEFEGLDIQGTVQEEIQNEATLQILADSISAKLSGEYVQRDELGKYVKTETYNSGITALDRNISLVTNKISNIESAGYITEEKAGSIIEANIDNISLSVSKKLTIGTRNILLNSACFRDFVLTGYVLANETIIATSGKNTNYPSGEMTAIRATVAPDVENYTHIGVRYKNAQILGEESITKIKTNTPYTLSFWLSDAMLAEGETRALSKNVLISAGSGATVTYTDDAELLLTRTPQRFTVTFTITGTISKFDLVFARKRATDDMNIFFVLSSVKLEEGNVATDWLPSVQEVEAKLDLCVRTDEEGNLLSAIHAKANQIFIETDKFNLDGEGNMSCNSATITGGTIRIGDEDLCLEIQDGFLSQNCVGTEVLKTNVRMNLNTQGGIDSIYSIFELSHGIIFENPGGELLAINNDGDILTRHIEIYSSPGNGQRLSSRSDDLYLSANYGFNDIILQGNNLRLQGRLIFFNYSNIGAKQPLYVNPGGEITT